MYRRRFTKRSGSRPKKSIILLVCLLLIFGVVLGGTAALLMDSTASVTNRFTPTQVTTTVNETRENNVKKDVHIQNTGNTEAWIRAAVVITWQDKDGNVYSQAPVVDTDYTIQWGAEWLIGEDGFYYWTSPVAANGGVTGDLIETCTSRNTSPEGYYLTVEIIGSGIQSEPDSVFNTYWKSSGLEVKENDGSKYLGVHSQGGEG